MYLNDSYLGILASTVDDMERTRIALANRLQVMTTDKKDKNGDDWGLGMDSSSPEVKVVEDLLILMGGKKKNGSGGIEHQSILNLQKHTRTHLLWKTWAADKKGIGEKTFARLLSSIGDPYWNALYDRPRTVSELWAYCGLHVLPTGVAPKRVKGQTLNWSQDARKRVFLISEGCLKQQDYYAEVYYEAKDKYAESLHNTVCVRCGPEKKPAQPGSPLNGKHKHARALRIVSKEILKDLWIASKDLHNPEVERAV